MTVRLVVTVSAAGVVNAVTEGVHGDKCLDYIDVLEDLLDARTVDSSYTADYHRQPARTIAEVPDVDHAEQQSRGWRLQRSLWLAIPILGFGCLGGSGLIFVGARLRRPATWIAGLVYTVVGTASFVVIGTTELDSAASDWATGILLATWAVSIVHAGLINSAWLQHLAGASRPDPSRLPPAWTAATRDRHPDALLPSVSEYYGTGAPAAAVTPSVVDSVDVNTASAQRLATLPGFDEVRASTVVAERQARGGFADVSEFAAVAGLAPHELVRVRAVVFCSPRAQPLWQPTDPPRGRVLDV